MKIALLLILVFSTSVLAEPPVLPLPTSDASVAKVARTCKGAVVATLLFAGVADIGAPCYMDYGLSRWQINTVLRGSYPAEARLDYRVRTCPQQSRQQVPVAGHKYILLSEPGSEHAVTDIFDFSDEKLQEVQRLLDAKPQ